MILLEINSIAKSLSQVIHIMQDIAITIITLPASCIVDIMKRSTKIRYRNDWMDFCGDGRFPKERIKGKDKKLLSKWSRKKLMKELDKE